MNKRLHVRKSVSNKIIFIMVFCLSISLILSAISIHFLISERAISKFSEELIATSELIGDRSKAALIFNDSITATDNLNTARYNSHIDSLCLYDKNLTLLSQYRISNNITVCSPNLHPKHEKGLVFKQDSIVLHKVIQEGNEVWGYLLVTANQHFLKQQHLYVISIIVLSLLISAIIALLLSRSMLKHTLSPLNSLLCVSEKISENPYLGIRAEKKHNDEIGDLVDAMNNMLNAIHHENIKLQASEIRFRTLAENTPVGIYLQDHADNYLYTNRKWQELTKLRDPKRREDYIQHIFSEDQFVYHQAIDNVKAQLTATIIEYRFLSTTGEQHVFMEYLAPFAKAYTGEIQVIGSILDISELKGAQNELEKLAFYDPLTNLSNRRFFRDHLNHRLALSAKTKAPLTILMIDLDNFKRINDSMGHDAGDQLLVKLAKKLSNALFPEDVVSRIGGDEFIVLLENLSDPAQIDHVANKLLSCITESVEISDKLIDSTCSIGVACYPKDADNEADLIRNADIALYKAKSAGKNRITFFSEELDKEVQQKVQLEQQLHQALINNEMEIYLQPQFDSNNQEFFWAEALLRWKTDLGYISPADFIPVAEETGIIIEIGNWVIDQVCHTLSEHYHSLSANGVRGISINLSARQFYTQGLVNFIDTTIKKYQISPGWIEFELTESMVMHDVTQAQSIMKQLRALGCRLSIDDFGTGYSSLAYLKQFDIDSLKIDKSFVDGLPEDSDDVAITSAILAMASRLGLSVVAEGIETAQQKQFLEQNGCRYMQGYLFTKPRPIAQFIKTDRKRADKFNIDELQLT